MNLFKGYDDKAKKFKNKAKGAAESQKLFLKEGGTGFENPVKELKQRKKDKLVEEDELEEDEEFEFEDRNERLAEQEFDDLFF